VSASARWWPRSLFGRLALILFCGLAAAHVLAFGLILHERAMAGKAMMFGYLPKDIAASVAILERVPAAERQAWLSVIERDNYRYILGAAPEGGPVEPAARELVAAIAAVLGARYNVSAQAAPSAVHPLQIRLYLQLRGGMPLAIELAPPRMTVSTAALLGLSLQLLVLLAFSWIAVRFVTRPLAQLARAADTLGPELHGAPLAEDGPVEVARAARAFNAMQRRVADHLAERVQILAAVSHDLQTPITRMRLRADLLEHDAVREKFHADLAAMQALVEEGIAYARSAYGAGEPPRRVDVQALLDSLAGDYADAGRPIRVVGHADRALTTRPLALRRIVANLVDNALKFATDAEVRVETQPSGEIAIAVCDRGPGIPPAELEAVVQPFYRLENSRNRQTGGTGLGLAIAQQLARAIGGTLILSNRDGGGLEARLVLRDPVDGIGPPGNALAGYGP